MIIRSVFVRLLRITFHGRIDLRDLLGGQLMRVRRLMNLVCHHLRLRIEHPEVLMTAVDHFRLSSKASIHVVHRAVQAVHCVCVHLLMMNLSMVKKGRSDFQADRTKQRSR